MDFAQVETRFKELKGQHDAGVITEEQFKAQLEDLMIQDEEGRWWMIGYETGQWYYHDGEKWVAGEPPRRAQAAPPPAEELPQLGRLIREEGFLLDFVPTVVAGVVWWLIFKVLEVDPLAWLGFNFLFAVAAAVVVWLVLRVRVTRRWRMLLALATAWVIAGRLGSTEFLEKVMYDFWEPVLILAFEIAVVLALGIGSSAFLARMLETRQAAEP